MNFNFYFNRLQEISAQDPDAYFVVTDDCLLIRVDHFLNKHYKFDLRDIVEDIVIRYSAGRYVYFYFYDGGNLNLSGFKEFLNYLQAQIGLDKPRTIVVTYQKTNIDNAVVIYTPISHFLSNTYTRLATVDLADDKFEKSFGCLLGRYDLYRLELIRHMHKHHAERSMLSCHMKPESFFFLEHHKLRDYYSAELEWIHQELPMPQPGQSFNTTRWGSVNWYDAIDQCQDLYNQFFIDVISETDYNSPDWFTEKTFKPLMLGRPFIMWSGCGALRSLHDLGFKTFSDIIDEHYDTIPNNRERFTAVINEIDRIGKCSSTELRDMHVHLADVFAHNRNRMRELWEFMDKTPWKAFSIL